MTALSEPAIIEALRRQMMRLDSRLADAAINPDASMFDERYLDSLGATELVAFVEQTYGLDIDADRLVSDLSSVRALAAWIAAEGLARS